jgi:Zn-dependent protease
VNPLTPDVLVLGLLRYIVFLFSTTCHEASHALAAKLGGDPTAFHSGQVSLNPIPHIRREPFGMVLVPLLALLTGGVMLGWASAPYDPLWQQRHPRRAAWMALAGPAANYTLVLIAAILIHAGLFLGVFQPPEQLNSLRLVDSATPGMMELAARLLSVLFSLNLLLGTFNLLPIPPLDGFGAIGILLPEGAAQRWNRLGYSLRAYSFLGLLICWRLFDQIYWPMFRTGVKLLYPGSMYR